jgi:hypothetical protein
MKKKLVTACLLAAMLAPTGAAARQAQKSPKRADESSAAALQQQAALQTLQFLRNSAGDVENPRERVRLLLEVADAFWPADRRQAREVFRLAAEQAAAHEDALDEKGRRAERVSLRQTVISRVARRDPAYANKLLADFAPKEAEPNPNDAMARLYGRDDPRGDTLVHAASEILPNDAAQAAQVARLAAADGFTQGLRQFLVTLRAKDAAAADALYETAFQAAAARRPKELVEALFLWDYAFQHGTIYLGRVSWLGEDAKVPAPVSLELKKRALTFAVEAIVENVQQFNLTAASEDDRPMVRERYVLIHSLASQVMPDVARLLPSSLPLLQTHLSRIEQELREFGSEPPAPPEPLPSTAGVNDDVEKMLNIASRVTNPQVRDGVYARAALSLYLHGDYQRALEVAGKIEGATLALQMTEPIRFDWAGSLIEKGELDAAAEVARALDAPEARATALAKVGGAYFAAKKPGPAAAVLAEAERGVSKANPSAEAAAATLAVARGYLDGDRDKALDVTVSALRAINAVEGDRAWELIQAGGAAGKLAVQGHHWETGRGGTVTRMTVNYPQTASLLDLLTKLSSNDLDEGLALARQLKSKGLSYTAQAVICRQAIERAQRQQLDKGVNGKGKLRSE